MSAAKKSRGHIKRNKSSRYRAKLKAKHRRVRKRSDRRRAQVLPLSPVLRVLAHPGLSLLRVHAHRGPQALSA